MIEIPVKLDIDELVILAGVITTHSIDASRKVSDTHWEIIIKLREKLVNALLDCTERTNEAAKVHMKKGKEETNGGGNAVQESPGILE